MKKKIITILLCITVLFTTACNKEENLNNSEVLANTFKTQITSTNDIKKVAETISKEKIIDTNVEVFDIETGEYLSGFKSEITGYKKAVGIRPMIGSIPFIAYIFDVDNPNEFASKLEKEADLRWNICTEADYMKTEVVNNYVFFVMIPKEF